jgi:hypothetical protein
MAFFSRLQRSPKGEDRAFHKAQRAQKKGMGLGGYSRFGFRGFAGGWAAAQPRADDAANPTNTFADSAPSAALFPPACVRTNTPAKQRPTHHSPHVTRYPPLPATPRHSLPRHARAKRCASMEDGVRGLRQQAGRCR